MLNTPAKKKTKPEYTCMCCMTDKKEDKFYKSQWTKVWTYSNKRVLFCKDCIEALMSEYTKRYDEKTALQICCALLDIPYIASVYQSIINNNSIFTISLYIKYLNGQQYRNKCFLNSIIDGELGKSDETVKEEIQSRWSKSDKQNKNFVLSIIGYDPFSDSELNDDDCKYCFNILANYCDIPGIKEDGYKLQSAIQITHSQLQCKKIDELINKELSANVSEDTIKRLTDTKKKLLDSISKTAQDNKLASAYNNASSQGSNTLSMKMKQMADDDYEPIKVNLFDIKTCGAVKQIADISNQSILD